MEVLPPTWNRKSEQVRPSAMVTDLRTGFVESRKHFAMEHAGGNADMARRTRREWPASNSKINSGNQKPEKAMHKQVHEVVSLGIEPRSKV